MKKFIKIIFMSYGSVFSLAGCAVSAAPMSSASSAATILLACAAVLLLLVLVWLYLERRRLKRKLNGRASEPELKTAAMKAIMDSKFSEQMTNMLNEMSSVFLAYDEKTFEQKMTDGVRCIAELMDLDGVSVWRNHSMPESIYTSQIYRWDAEAGGTAPPREELIHIPLNALTSAWEEILAGNRVINGPISKMNDPPAAFIKFGVVSALLTPLFYNGEYWGFVLFEDLRNERYFEEVEAMRSAAFLCANTVIRSETENKLKEALVAATGASQAKSDFLANMSHEIRTPMNAIIGMTNIGKSTDDYERMSYCFEKIEEASKHLLGIINDILDMSKIEAGKFDLAPIEFDFERMLQRVVNVVNYRADEKEQKLTVYIDRSIPQFLICDEQRLAQIITNLLSNAVKFTPAKGAVSINTYFLGETDGVCTIRISVRDTGIGISPEQQINLFQSFQQAESSTSRKYGGTGLGLAISKNIVEMMGGEIVVESEAGVGSMFMFTVKMRHGERKQRARQWRANAWEALRVAAVDDDMYILEDLKGIVGRLGVKCDVANNADEAFEMAEKSGGYNVYFVDWRMPGTNGVEFTRALRQKKYPAGEPAVIMMSSAEISSVVAEAKAAGVDKFLQKPLFPSTIRDILSEYVGIEPEPEGGGGADYAGVFAGRRILLAEDVDLNREIVAALLEPTGIEIDFAKNGGEAVAMFGERPEYYEMILMDVQMPEMDGYEATRRIRALGAAESATVPIIAMTANVFREDVEKCLAAGMDGHVGKPLDIGVLLGKLGEYLTPFSPSGEGAGRDTGSSPS